MIFRETPLAGAYFVDLEPVADERGFFARSWCKREFEEEGLNTELVQCNISFNRRRGTLRGLHFQKAPWPEVKLVRCSRGAIYDVIVDLRRTSSTYGHWISAELSAENGRMLYVPAGFAHGFQALTENTEVFYQMSEFFHSDAQGGLRWNDPDLMISWPIDEMIISERDQALPRLSEIQ